MYAEPTDFNNLNKKSSLKETQIRVPQIHGLPKQTFGFTEMRFKRVVMIAMPSLEGWKSD